MRKGFTLAEVLITLAAIGVVAALTLPSLALNTQNREIYTAFLKSYNTFVKVTQLSEIENGNITSWNWDVIRLGDTDVVNKYMNKFLNIVQDCGIVNDGNCFANEYSLLTGEVIGDYFNTYDGGYKIKLADGSSVLFVPQNSKDGVCDSKNLNCMEIYIDTNGAKGPNVLGRDLLVFVLGAKGFLPKDLMGQVPNNPGVFENKSMEYIVSRCDPSEDDHPGFSCGARMLLEGGMNY